MSGGRKAIVRMYQWKDLLRLAVNEAGRTSGLRLQPDDEVHFIHGLDVDGNVFLRVDVRPLKVRRRQ